MQHTDNQTIISTSPTATNTLFELAAAEKIIACTTQSTPTNPLYSTKTKIGMLGALDIETIKTLNPKLIIAHRYENTQQEIQSLSELGIDMYVLEGESLSQVYKSIETLGEKIDKRTQASKLTAKIRYQLETFATQAISYQEIPTAFFTASDPYKVAAKHSLINELLALNNLYNVYQDIEKTQAEVQLATLKILDPQLILLPDYPVKMDDQHAFEVGKYTEHALTVFVPGDVFTAGVNLLSLPKFYEQLNIKMRREQEDNLANRGSETYF